MQGIVVIYKSVLFTRLVNFSDALQKEWGHRQLIVLLRVTLWRPLSLRRVPTY